MLPAHAKGHDQVCNEDDRSQEMRQRGRTGVSVPKRDKARRCTFKKVKNGPYTWVGFDTMLEVLEFFFR